MQFSVSSHVQSQSEMNGSCDVGEVVFSDLPPEVIANYIDFSTWLNVKLTCKDWDSRFFEVVKFYTETITVYDMPAKNLGLFSGIALLNLRLDLMPNWVGDELVIPQLSKEHCENFFKLTNLQKLHLYNYPEDQIGFFLKNLNKLTGLKVLDLCYTNQLGDQVSYLVDYLNDLTACTELDLANIDFKSSALVQLKSLTMLTRLCLSSMLDANRDDNVAHLADLIKLTHLELIQTTLSDGGLFHLKNLTDLTYLDLYNANITNEGLFHLKKLTGLTHLDVGRTSVNGAGLSHLNGMPNLTYLDLSGNYDAVDAFGNQFGERALAAIAGSHLKQSTFPHLQSLSLCGAKSTEGDLAQVATLTQLQKLFLSYADVDIKGLHHLKKLKCLYTLDLEGTNINDEDVKALSGILCLLEALYLSSTSVTDTAIQYLTGSSSLRRIYLNRTKITLDGAKHLIDGLRNLEELGIASFDAFEMMTNLKEVYPHLSFC